MKRSGLLLIAVSVAVPLYWFGGLWSKDPLAIFSQYLGSIALVVMGISQLLATRGRWLEAVFGGLDRIYVLHKWLGISAMAMILVHDTVDAEIDGKGPETLLTDLGETLGEISLYGLLILVTISLVTFIPYHLWHWTHRFMGALFAFGAAHYLMIMKPFSVLDPLGLYIASFCLLGILCYVYTLIPIGSRAATHRYRVSETHADGGALVVELEPEARGLRHQAGQFAFLRFHVDGAEEIHPFSISSAPRDDRSLRFTMKSLGDWTRAAPSRLEPGTMVSVEGPFGHFLKRRKEPQVWIAAGVGITPFVGAVESLQADGPPVDLYYCFRSRAKAPHLAEIERLAADNNVVQLHLAESGKDPRLNAVRIWRDIGDDLTRRHVSFCGPTSMAKSLRDDLGKHGVSPRRFHSEAFEIRSGIGVLTMGRWLLRLFAHKTASQQNHH